jgi:hypothetical protein
MHKILCEKEMRRQGVEPCGTGMALGDSATGGTQPNKNVNVDNIMGGQGFEPGDH